MIKQHILVFLMLLSGLALNAQQSLEEYFAVAAENNPGLKARYKSFEAAMQRTARVSSLPDPTLTFGYFISPVETRVGPQRARFSLSQMFPWFGTLTAFEDESRLLAEAKFQQFLDARNQLYLEVARAYYQLYELDALRSIENENVEVLTSYSHITTTRYENNQGSMIDVLRVDIMLKEASTDLEILGRKQKPLVTNFNKLLNRPDSIPVKVQDSIPISAYKPGYGKDSLLARNPILEELALKIKATEAQEEAAVRQGWPKLGVGLDYVIVDERTDLAVPDNGKDVLMPMVSLSLPVFRAKYNAARQEAQLMQESYSFQQEEITNQLISNYELAWFKLEKQLELVALYQVQIFESRQSLNLLYSDYGNSGKDFEEVLRMQQQILKYKKLKASAVSQYLIAMAEMDYLTAKSK